MTAATDVSEASMPRNSSTDGTTAFNGTIEATMLPSISEFHQQHALEIDLDDESWGATFDSLEHSSIFAISLCVVMLAMVYGVYRRWHRDGYMKKIREMKERASAGWRLPMKAAGVVQAFAQSKRAYTGLEDDPSDSSPKRQPSVIERESVTIPVRDVTGKSRSDSRHPSSEHQTKNHQLWHRRLSDLVLMYDIRTKLGPDGHLILDEDDGDDDDDDDGKQKERKELTRRLSKVFHVRKEYFAVSPLDLIIERPVDFLKACLHWPPRCFETRTMVMLLLSTRRWAPPHLQVDPDEECARHARHALLLMQMRLCSVATRIRLRKRLDENLLQKLKHEQLLHKSKIDRDLLDCLERSPLQRTLQFFEEGLQEYFKPPKQQGHHGKLGYHRIYSQANQQHEWEEHELCEPLAAPWFTSMERIQIMEHMIEAPEADGGLPGDDAGPGDQGDAQRITQLIEKGVLHSAMPMHFERVSNRKDHSDIQQGSLRSSWIRSDQPVLAQVRNFFLPDQPLESDIRDYFGEEIALYFAFVQSLTYALICPAALGILSMVYGWKMGSFDNWTTSVYGMAVLVWIFAFSKYWLWRSNELAFMWNIEERSQVERKLDNTGTTDMEDGYGMLSEDGHFVSLDVHEKELASLADVQEKGLHHGGSATSSHSQKPPEKKLPKFDRPARSMRMIVTYTAVCILIGLGLYVTMRIMIKRNLYMAQYDRMAREDFEQDLVASIACRIFWQVQIVYEYRVFLGSAKAALLNSVWIVLFGFLFRMLAEHLNDFENHMEQSSYDNSLITKTFMFQFVNSYASLYYIAFVKATGLSNQLFPMSQERLMRWTSANFDYCHDPSDFRKSPDDIFTEFRQRHGMSESVKCNPFCIDELTSYLSVLVFTSHILSVLFKVLLPRLVAGLKHYLHRKRATSDDDDDPIRDIYRLEAWRPEWKGVMLDYNDSVIGIGYVVLFAQAFPLTASLVYLASALKIRFDAHLLLHLVRRPWPRQVNSIGRWGTIIRVLGVIGVVTNACLALVTSTDLITRLPFRLPVLDVQIDLSNYKVFVVVVEHIVIALQYLVMSLVLNGEWHAQVSKNRCKTRWKEGILFGILARASRFYDRSLVADMRDRPELKDMQFSLRCIERKKLEEMSFEVSHSGEYTVDLNKDCLKKIPDALSNARFTKGSKVVSRASGRLSAVSQVTLPNEDRKAVNIPQKASYFAFAYPLSKLSMLSDEQLTCLRAHVLLRTKRMQLRRAVEEAQASSRSLEAVCEEWFGDLEHLAEMKPIAAGGGSSHSHGNGNHGRMEWKWDAINFLMNGGFVYYDQEWEVLQVNALLAPDSHPDPSRPARNPADEQPTALTGSKEDQKKLSALMNTLERAGRLEPVTFPDLRKMGIDSFCWVLPGERFPIESTGDVPWSAGGFVYRYREDTSEKACSHDCYYVVRHSRPVQSGNGKIGFLGPFQAIRSYEELDPYVGTSLTVTNTMVHHFMRQASQRKANAARAEPPATAPAGP